MSDGLPDQGLFLCGTLNPFGPKSHPWITVRLVCSPRGLKSRIHRRAYRNRELSEAQKAANTTRSKVRARRACIW
jgi:hypothetical protein